jgi:hypothetical protein
VAVVQQAIEDRGRDDGIAEDRAPFPDRAVGGDQQAAALVAPRDKLEEVRGVGLEGQIRETTRTPARDPGVKPSPSVSPSSCRIHCPGAFEEEAAPYLAAADSAERAD